MSFFGGFVEGWETGDKLKDKAIERREKKRAEETAKQAQEILAPLTGPQTQPQASGLVGSVLGKLRNPNGADVPGPAQLDQGAGSREPRRRVEGAGPQDGLSGGAQPAAPKRQPLDYDQLKRMHQQITGLIAANPEAASQYKDTRDMLRDMAIAQRMRSQEWDLSTPAGTQAYLSERFQAEQDLGLFDPDRADALFERASTRVNDASDRTESDAAVRRYDALTDATETSTEQKKESFDLKKAEQERKRKEKERAERDRLLEQTLNAITSGEVTPEEAQQLIRRVPEFEDVEVLEINPKGMTQIDGVNMPVATVKIRRADGKEGTVNTAHLQQLLNLDRSPDWQTGYVNGQRVTFNAKTGQVWKGGLTEGQRKNNNSSWADDVIERKNDLGEIEYLRPGRDENGEPVLYPIEISESPPPASGPPVSGLTNPRGAQASQQSPANLVPGKEYTLDGKTFQVVESKNGLALKPIDR